MRLVADIGGTNARIAFSKDGVINGCSIQRFANDEWDRLDDVLHAYIHAHTDIAIDDMVIAVAGPVNAGSATLTNRNWTIAAADLSDSFACKGVVLLNDLTALGYAVPMFKADQVDQICGTIGPTSKTRQALVVGIGTGFNVSQVITKGKNTVCPTAEAGHISMPGSIASKLQSCGCDPNQFPTVETLFSGRGLTSFCQQFSGLPGLTGTIAIADYARGQRETVGEIIETYASLMGLLLRELSLSYMPTHGIFLAGSVARAVATYTPDPLIKVLQRPCAFRSEKNPSVFIAKDDGAALLGCASVTVL
jgi:glucokinase